MAKTVILGAGFSGQYAALILQNALKGKGDHSITVVNPHPKFTDIPSLVWAGIGQIQPEDAQFELAPVYDRLGIDFIKGWPGRYTRTKATFWWKPMTGSSGWTLTI